MNNGREREEINTDAGVVAPAPKQTKKRVITAARKEQNRLAQRAYRKRHREQKTVQKQTVTPSLRRLQPRQDNPETLNTPDSPSSSRSDTVLESLRGVVNSLASPSTRDADQTTSDLDVRTPSETDLQSISSQSSPSMSQNEVETVALATVAGSISKGTDGHPPALINMVFRSSLEDYSTTVFRACLSNAICIGIDLAELMYCERPCMSPFYRPAIQDPTALVTTPSHDSLPASLRPTPAQILIPHHASMDLIPLPRLRERAILMCAALPRHFSLWEMKIDIYARNALVVQNRDTSSGSAPQPWDMRCWEAAPWFLSKWKMVVDTDEVKTSLSVPGIPGLWM
ncbi:hypothetical protein F5Y03DRAFT_210891 [Xylaria venustula]|nr:hypothetical protein F5Y03DRAFT_210891 [Xylaria venustula]